MTKREFLGYDSFEEAMRALQREESWVLDYEGYKEYIIEVIERGSLRYAEKLLKELQLYDEEREYFWWKRKGGKLPMILESVEDVDFLLDDDGTDYLPEADDNYYYKVVKGVR